MVLSFLVLSACDGGPAETPVVEALPTPVVAETFDIAMVTFPGYAPLYLAKEKGFFGDTKVELKRIESIAAIRAAVAGKDAEAYLATPDIALDSDTRPPGVAVWALDESSGGDGVVISGDVKDVAGLRGKTIAAEPGFPPYFILTYLLSKHDMTLADLTIKDMTTQDAATAFSSGAVDGAAIYEPYLSTVKTARAGSQIVISSADTPGMIVDLLVVREDKLADTHAIDNVVSGWRKAVAYIATNPDDAYAVMAKSFEMPVDAFKDAAGGVKWLSLAENQALFGSVTAPGTLPDTTKVVRDVLKKNRPAVFETDPANFVSSDVVARQQ